MGTILSIVAIVFCFSLYEKIKMLEKNINDLQRKQRNTHVASDAHKHTHKPAHAHQTHEHVVKNPITHKQPEPFVASAVSHDDNPSPFITWVTTDWPMKLGAFLLLLGFGWLTSYAFMNNWIGPVGRITLSLITGALILVGGTVRMKDYRNQGSVLVTLGASITLLTIFAARSIYGFFTPTIALSIMSLVIIFVSAISVKNKNLPLAILSLLIGGIAPLLSVTPELKMPWLFSYLFLLCGGYLWVTAVTNWRMLTTIALGIVSVYNLPFIFGGVTSVSVALVFAFLFAALFYVANLASMIYTKKATASDLMTAGLNGLLLLLWIGSTAPEQWQSLLTAGTTLLFVLGAFLTHQLVKLKEPMYLYTGIAIVFLAAATAFELSGSALVIAYTIQASIIAATATYLFKRPLLGQLLSGLLIVPMLLSAQSIASHKWATSILHADFFVLFILSFALLGLGTAFYLYKQFDTHAKALPEATAILFAGGTFFSFTLIWLSLHTAITNSDTAVMTSLVIYTVISLYFYLSGKLTDNRAFRIAGAIILGLVTLRLLSVDIWQMAIAGKIITFFIIGTLLIGTSFIGNKKN